MEKLTADKIYLNSILLGVMMNFTPFCGEERAKETHTFLKKVFDKLERYEDADSNNILEEDVKMPEIQRPPRPENGNKFVNYKNNTFVIDYNYTTEKGINGKTYHTIEIYQMNNGDIKPFEYAWETQGQIKSIIDRIKIAIENYLDHLLKKEYSYYDEFQNWDGDLDHWDE